jgi:hypothetical protein
LPVFSKKSRRQSRAAGTKIAVERLWAMPIRWYFTVIGPALAAVLWWVSSALEPSPPARPAAIAQARAAPASSVAAKPQVHPFGATAAAATPAPPDPPAPSVAAASAPASPSSGLEIRPSVETTKPVETTRSATQPKHKKRKQIAHRRQHRETYGAAYAHGSPYPAYGSRDQYAGSPPFYGYNRW